MMTMSRLDCSGGVLTGEFAKYVAEEQKSEAFTMKQQRLSQEEDDKRRATTKKAGDRTIGHVTYTVTHHRIECVVVERRVRRVARPKATQRWATIESLAALPITSPGRRIVVLLAEDGRKA